MSRPLTNRTRGPWPTASHHHPDTLRLAWMAQRGAHVTWSKDSEVCNVWLPAEFDGTEARPAEGYPQKCYYDWRDAIDAAIKANP